MTRANARELAVHLIYSRCFTGDEPAMIIQTRLNKDYYNKLSGENQVYTQKPNSAQKAYLDTVVSGVANREEELNAVIQEYAIGWDINRISKLARSIMQLAIFEMLYVEDVPVGAAISEAVRITKLYESDEIAAFVNGILGAFARRPQAEVQE